MSQRIKTGDTVKIIAGHDKGQTGKVLKIQGDLVFVEGLGQRVRHFRANQYRNAGKKDIHVGIHTSKVALVVDTKTNATSRVGYTKNDDGKTVRLARQANNREIK